jgi:2-methylaconitate cis-trans-isomerase PrpF
MRGGTSRGAYLLADDLPQEPELRDQLILALYGSPDQRQIDGLGGADSLTSKVAIVAPSSRSDIDVEYTFGQVRIAEPVIDYKGTCGNMMAGIGPYAIDEGLIPAQEPLTRVRILDVNTNQRIVAEVPVRDGKALVDGECEIAGVPWPGARIMLDWIDCVGPTTGKLLPTGKPVETLKADLGAYTASLVDAGNPVVFVLAEELGLKGTELPKEIGADEELLRKLEDIRSTAAEVFGFVSDRKEGTSKSPAIPKVAFVSPPADYVDANGQSINASEIGLVSRIMSMQRPHQAYAVSGAICTALAAQVQGSVVNQVFRPTDVPSLVAIGHPRGILRVDAVVEMDGDLVTVRRAALERTARRIMEGMAYVPASRVRVPAAAAAR